MILNTTKNALKPPGFARDTVIAAVGTMVEKLRGIVSLFVIVRLMGTASFGVWAQAMAFMTFVAGSSELCLHQALVRFGSEVKDSESRSRYYFTTMCVVLVIGLAACAVVLHLSDAISQFLLNNNSYGLVFRAAAVWIPCQMVFMINLHMLRAEGRILSYTLQSATLSTLDIVLIVFVLAFNQNLLHLILSLAGLRLLISVCQIVLLRSRLAALTIDLDFLKRALTYSIPLIPGQLSTWIMDRIDRFFIGAMLGPTALGIYSGCYNVASAVRLLIAPFGVTLLPYISRYWNENKSLACQYAQISTKVFALASIPATLVLGVFSEPIMSVLANEEMGQSSRVILFLVASGITCWGMGVIRGPILHGAEKTHVLGIVRVFSALLNVVLNLVLIPKYQLVGAAIATLAAYATASLLIWLLSAQHIDVTPKPSFFIRIILLNSVFALVLLALRRFPTGPAVFLFFIAISVHASISIRISGLPGFLGQAPIRARDI